MLLAATASAVLMLLQQAPAEGTDWDAEFGVEVKQRDPVTGELPVDPYEQSNANAGAAPYATAAQVAGQQMRGVADVAKVQGDALAALMDRLFPYQAASRKFAEEMALIQASRLSDAEKELAIARLENESFADRAGIRRRDDGDP
ncbi:hypothetical protein [Porphyrobacter sp. AAP82]|uniref:hypothetical protein n=1 Tax=Porphyrobacter sp. AAP82 TaxID=1248917 RepID=UPI0003030A5E|nr:hypothetical protein [Porphyrobacter sp. AAP82]